MMKYSAASLSLRMASSQGVTGLQLRAVLPEAGAAAGANSENDISTELENANNKLSILKVEEKLKHMYHQDSCIWHGRLTDSREHHDEILGSLLRVICKTENGIINDQPENGIINDASNLVNEFVDTLFGEMRHAEQVGKKYTDLWQSIRMGVFVACLFTAEQPTEFSAVNDYLTKIFEDEQLLEMMETVKKDSDKIAKFSVCIGTHINIQRNKELDVLVWLPDSLIPDTNSITIKTSCTIPDVLMTKIKKEANIPFDEQVLILKNEDASTERLMYSNLNKLRYPKWSLHLMISANHLTVFIVCLEKEYLQINDSGTLTLKYRDTTLESELQFLPDTRSKMRKALDLTGKFVDGFRQSNSDWFDIKRWQSMLWPSIGNGVFFACLVVVVEDELKGNELKELKEFLETRSPTFFLDRRLRTMTKLVRHYCKQTH